MSPQDAQAIVRGERPITVAEAAAVLREHNQWRRGDCDDEADVVMQSPRLIGLAIDALVEHAEANPVTDVRRGRH